MSSVMWSYYNRFEGVNDRYLPARGEGDTMATQIVTAVNKLVYKWYNDGDVYDNTCYLKGWWNDLSSYANWLEEYADAEDILRDICHARDDDDYELILKRLADRYLNWVTLEEYAKKPKEGTIYKCDGPYEYAEHYDEDEDEDWYEHEDDDFDSAYYEDGCDDYNEEVC